MRSKPIKLSGRALALAECVNEVWHEMNSEADAVEQKALAEIKRIREAGNTAVKERMAALFNEVGIPPEVHKYYSLDARYLKEFGDAYVIQSADPAAEAVVTSAPEKPIDRKKLH